MLEQLFGSKLRVSVLTWLVLHPGRRYYVRQLERILGADSANLSRELSKLENTGLLTSVIEGRQKYFSVDIECPVFPELQGLITKSIDLPFLLRGALSPLLGRISTAFIVGGSIETRNDRNAKSSSDGAADCTPERELVVIGNCGTMEIEQHILETEERYGCNFVITSITAGEWAKKLSTGDRRISALASMEKQFITGDEDSLSGSVIRSRLTDAIESWADKAHPGGADSRGL